MRTPTGRSRAGAAKSVKIRELRPYLSVLLLEQSPVNRAGVVQREILDALSGVLRLKIASGVYKIIARSDDQIATSLTVGCIHYTERRPAPWTSDGDAIDVYNQLALVAVRNTHVAVLLTDSARVGAVIRRVGPGGEGALALLRLIPEGTLNAAFAMGAARTLWLSGIHARTSVKADSKVLIGIDLRDALDPLGDQSYYFTALRATADLGKGPVTIGASPRRSRIWTGASRSWPSFVAELEAVLKAIENTKAQNASDPRPIDLLAAMATSGGPARDAYDVEIVAPETAEDLGHLDTEAIERWAFAGRFTVTSTKGASLTATASLDDEVIAALDLTIDASRPERVAVSVAVTPAARGDTGARAKELKRICDERRWLQVRYASGHTLSDGTLYTQSYADVMFNGWKWIPFDGYNVEREKPVKEDGSFDPEAIGRQDSLFCWVWGEWPRGGRARGWLACDDGSMEMADFIHWEGAQPPSPAVLTLIHVKASHGNAVGRGISVADYEVVCSQAVKNLRHLDRDILAAGLQGGIDKRVGKKVWHNGAIADRSGFLKALNTAGYDYLRQVVILQPRVVRQEFDGARADIKAHRHTPRAARLRQLEALLVGTENACRAFGASLTVLAAESPPGASGMKVSTNQGGSSR